MSPRPWTAISIVSAREKNSRKVQHFNILSLTGSLKISFKLYICGYCRYLDSSLIDGTLDISLLSEQGLLSTRSIDSLRVLSMMNNSISNVVYDAQNIESIFTVIRWAHMRLVEIKLVEMTPDVQANKTLEKSYHKVGWGAPGDLQWW